MTVEFLTRNWSLAIASVLLTAIALFLLHRVYTDSARGQLRRRLRELASRYRDVDRAQRAVEKAEHKLQRLGARVAAVKPRHIDEARESLEDARSLLKIAADQVAFRDDVHRMPVFEELLLPVVVSSTVFFELIGPVMARYALVQAGEIGKLSTAEK